VLKYEYSRNKAAFGSGLLGMHYFYPRYRSFLSKLKLWASSNKSKQPEIFFGSVDIRHCYDNIDQEHLLKIVDGILTQEEYLLQKYNVVHPVDSLHRVTRRQKKQVNPTEQFNPFYQSVNELSKDYHGCVFVDGVSCVAVKKEQAMLQLREHLTSHMVVTEGRYGNRYLLQAKGIPQGSVLSSLLCNFYYGDIERRLLTNNSQKPSSAEGGGMDDSCVKGDISFFVRMVDDFMLITTNQDDLHTFLDTMDRGDLEKGVAINKEKTRVSANVEYGYRGDNPNEQKEKSDKPRGQKEESTESATMESGEIGDKSEKQKEARSNDRDGWFSWCGMLFHIHSGEVQIDYSRFHDGKGGDGLTVERVSREGENLLVKMRTFVRPRCLPLLYDSFINSPDTQVVNFYQMCVFAAVKTGKYLESLTCNSINSCRDSTLKKGQFLLKGIESTISYAFDLIQRRLETQGTNESADDLKIGLARPVALWLGWQAFFDVFPKLPHLKECVANNHHYLDKKLQHDDRSRYH
jgi:telomerase reverse transcriptase